MRRTVLLLLSLSIFATTGVFAQEKSVLLPKRLEGSPFKVTDSDDKFGQAYRWFIEGEVDSGTVRLKELIAHAGISLDPTAYYIVAANFDDGFTPIGMIHGSDHFLNTRMFGLGESNLYYMFITRDEGTQSYVSVLATKKSSPAAENLLPFLSLFIPVIPASVATLADADKETYIDIRQFEVPKAYRKNADLSFLVKKQLSDERMLGRADFDNTAKERFSYGIATAITSIDDLDIIIGNDGTIIVRPKDNLDLATFAALNIHLKPIDTKAKNFGNSFHLMAGIRLTNFIEPLVGLGASFDLGAFDLGIFGGYSVEVANELEEGFEIGQRIDAEVDPFKIKLRGKPRFGLQVKFP